ncbi:MAG: ATP-binding protein [Halobacteriaceae archaeon]
MALTVGVAAAIAYVRRLDDGRLLFLVVVLGLMAVNQGLELSNYLTSGIYPDSGHAAVLETLVNLLAAGSINYVVWHFYEERMLRENLAALNRFLRHDLRNDLNVVRGHVEGISPGDERERSSLDAAVTGIDAFVRKAERTRHLETFVQEHAGSPRSRDLETVLTPAVERVRDRFPGAAVRYDPPEDTSVLGGEILTSVFEMLVENAVVHNETPANVWVDVSESTDRTVAVSVADDGPGIPPGKREMLVEGDERDPLEHSEGLGLFFVRTVVDRWRGDVRIRDRDGGGTVVTVSLPKPTPWTRLRNRLVA